MWKESVCKGWILYDSIICNPRKGITQVIRNKSVAYKSLSEAGEEGLTGEIAKTA